MWQLVPPMPKELTPAVLGWSVAGQEPLVLCTRRPRASSGISGFAVSKFGSVGGVEGMLFGALTFGAIVLLVIALVVLREYTGQWDRPWREPKRAANR